MISSFFEVYWPHILAILSVVLGVSAAIHATMTKREVRTAIGWVGVIILSPILGAVIYGLFGINRIRGRTVSLQRRNMSDIEHFHLSDYDMSVRAIQDKFGDLAIAMKRLGDHVSRCSLTLGNSIELLDGGDQAYERMLAAIKAAKRNIVLESYIFDRDRIGEDFALALGEAVQRGLEVRVLIDAVGARYSMPSIVKSLQKYQVPVRVFNGNIIMGLRLPYANLRTHRKILVIDGQIAFTGGLNIREGFSARYHGDRAAQDTHFQLTGPVVSDLFHVVSEDWRFTTGEKLLTPAFIIQQPTLKSDQGVAIRVVPSGPDKTVETNQRMLIGAFSIAQHHIRIMTPYLLPDRELVSALVTAARRGVKVDIVVPDNNNLKLVDRAMRAQFDQLLQDGCHIWRAKGVFDHSKLITIDHTWSYVGSSNLDSRSLRLNFEVDLEVFDHGFARQIASRIDREIDNAYRVELKALKARPFINRLIDRVIWLGSPYL